MPAAVIVHSTLPVDPDVLGMLQPEEGLLIRSARRQVDYSKKEDTDLYGESVYAHYSGFRLSWEVDADALVLAGGLGDYHPGMLLGPEALAFANGDTDALPFRFDMGDNGRILYESPSQEPSQGGLCGVRFRAVLDFADRRLIGGSAWGGADSAGFTSWRSALVTAGRVKGERGGMMGGTSGVTGFLASRFGSIFPETSALDYVSVDGWAVHAWAESADGYVTGGSSAATGTVAGNVVSITTGAGRYRWVLVSP